MPILTSTILAAAGAPLLLGSSATGWVDYTVRPGDTLYDIAAAHRVQVSTLVRANHLAAGGHLIRAGAKIRVPGSGVRHRAQRPTRTYVVRSGDTVSHLALRFRVAESTVLLLNQLDRFGRIRVGQRLVLPAHAAKAPAKRSRSTAAAVTTRPYTVRSGDTVSAIAVRSGATVAAVLKANRLSMASRIHPGQVLHVPVRKAFSSNTFAGRTYPDSVVSAAAAYRTRLASRAVPSRDVTRALVASTARRYGVDPALALAVAYQESGWNQRQVSVASAIGVMQVIPSSGRWASDLVGRRLDLLDTRDNVTAGVVILKALTRSAPSADKAIAGYYQGLGSVQKYGMYADTKRYVRSITTLRARFR